jgi:hypothetical protein
MAYVAVTTERKADRHMGMGMGRAWDLWELLGTEEDGRWPVSLAKLRSELMLIWTDHAIDAWRVFLPSFYVRRRSDLITQPGWRLAGARAAQRLAAPISSAVGHGSSALQAGRLKS